MSTRRITTITKLRDNKAALTLYLIRGSAWVDFYYLGASEDTSEFDNTTTTYLHASAALQSREMLLLLCIPIMNIPISKQHDQHSQEPDDRAPIPALYPDMARL